ncbi:hypothetical protein [Undibacterium sp. RuTC16W]|uniref:hypothetical protein n=1 Tax=Undibacterium sp. RuTC16W TaxID=3413048 RepID=UPI003BEFB284
MMNGWYFKVTIPSLNGGDGISQIYFVVSDQEELAVAMLIAKVGDGCKIEIENILESYEIGDSEDKIFLVETCKPAREKVVLGT